jgi:hypothetical protein
MAALIAAGIGGRKRAEPGGAMDRALVGAAREDPADGGSMSARGKGTGANCGNWRPKVKRHGWRPKKRAASKPAAPRRTLAAE